MADSKCLNFERLCDFCKCDDRLQSFLRLHKVLFNFHGQCYRCGIVSINLRQDRTTADGQIWRCSNRKWFLFVDIVSFPDTICRFLKSSSLSTTGLTSIRNILFFTKPDCPTKLSLTSTTFAAKCVSSFWKIIRNQLAVLDALWKSTNQNLANRNSIAVKRLMVYGCSVVSRETVIHRVASLKLSLIDQPRHSFLSSRVGFCWAQQSIQTAGARTLPSSPKATYIPL